MDEESIGGEALPPVGPAKGPVTEQQIEEDLEQGKIYRLNDRFFKFLFGREERKHLFLDLVNSLVFPDERVRGSRASITPPASSPPHGRPAKTSTSTSWPVWRTARRWRSRCR